MISFDADLLFCLCKPPSLRTKDADDMLSPLALGNIVMCFATIDIAIAFQLRLPSLTYYVYNDASGAGSRDIY